MILQLFNDALHSHFDVYSDSVVDKRLFTKSSLRYKRKGQYVVCNTYSVDFIVRFIWQIHIFRRVETAYIVIFLVHFIFKIHYCSFAFFIILLL
jgi:hypothetical protein